jgi:hypothetical protein
MALNTVSLSFGYYPDPTKGRPVFNGSIFIGEPDLDPTILANQKTITIRQEGVDTPSVPQPISTSAGGVPVFNGSPAEILVDGAYSMAVLNNQDTQVYYVASQNDSASMSGTDKRYGPIFATVAAMKAANPVSIDGEVVTLVAGMTVQTQGYTTAGDFGEGTYLIVASQAADEVGDHTAANGTVAVLDKKAPINILQYGAIGDGVVDDAASHVAAFAANTAVFNPGGKTYNIATEFTIPVGRTWSGDGFSGGSIINTTFALGEGISVDNKLVVRDLGFIPLGASPKVFKGTSKTGISIRDCVFDFQFFTGIFFAYDSNSRAIDLIQCGSVDIRYNEFRNAWNDHVFDASSVGGNNCQRCVSVENLGESTVSINNNIFDNVWTASLAANVNHLETCFNIVPTPTADTVFFDRCTAGVTRNKKLNFNTITDAGKGAIKVLDSNNLTAKGHIGEVIGNQINGYGVLLATEAIFSKNHFDFGVSDVYTKAAVADRATNLVIANNTVRNATASSTALGLANIQRATITGNIFEQLASTGDQTYLQWCGGTVFASNKVLLTVGRLQMFDCDSLLIESNDIEHGGYLRFALNAVSGAELSVKGNRIENTLASGSVSNTFGINVITTGGVVGCLLVEGNIFKTTIVAEDGNGAGNKNIVGTGDAANADHSLIDNNIVIFSDATKRQKTMFGDILNPIFFVGNRGSTTYNDTTKVMTTKPSNDRTDVDTITWTT